MSRHCSELHEIFNEMKRMRFPYESESIPNNGVYIMFEKNELGHGMDRIVRVGSHKCENKLSPRLNEHFLKENKDRSILRKNIGRAILNKNNDDYIRIWDLRLTTRANRERYLPIIDIDYQKKIEKEVTKYIQDMFSFVVIEENNKEKRLWIEKRLISEMSNCSVCKASENWFGRYSTKEKIRKSGLWLEIGLYGDGFNEVDFEEFKKRLL